MTKMERSWMMAMILMPLDLFIAGEVYYNHKRYKLYREFLKSRCQEVILGNGFSSKRSSILSNSPRILHLIRRIWSSVCHVLLPL